jgi:hypothetical protein
LLSNLLRPVVLGTQVTTTDQCGKARQQMSA